MHELPNRLELNSWLDLEIDIGNHMITGVRAHLNDMFRSKFFSVRRHSGSVFHCHVCQFVGSELKYVFWIIASRASVQLGATGVIETREFEGNASREFNVLWCSSLRKNMSMVIAMLAFLHAALSHHIACTISSLFGAVHVVVAEIEGSALVGNLQFRKHRFAGLRCG